MSDHIRHALAMLEAARPKSGSIPATKEEWTKALRANEELAYAMYREAGLPKNEARSLARQTHGGPVGLKLLRTAFMSSKND